MKLICNISFTFGINGSLRKVETYSDNPVTEHYLFNSAANLKAYGSDAADFAYYGYNASNTRTYKLNFLNANSWVNGQQLPIHPQSIQAMFYPNAYLNFNQSGEYTKHYYNGTERIASRLGNTALSISMEMTDRLQERVGKLETRFQDDIRELVYTNVQVETPPVSVSSLQSTGTATDIFYYHTNHLGSTAFVTDQNQNVTQGFLYAPFGEITTEFNAIFGNDIIPKYSFNAKELDEETGMYYYEARYYKPPVFTSRDPMFEKYFWMTPYAYCANNPVKYVDPSGKTVVLTGVNSDSNQSAFESVQQGTNLTLWYENNILYCNGNILNDYDQQLYNAITDKNVIVEIEVVTSNVNYVFGKTEDGIDMSFIPINGHCLGAHYYNIDLELFTFGLVHDSYSFSYAKNVIYLDGLKSMEKKGAEGSGIIHEITEAYRFGLRALQLKTDLPPVIKTQEEIDNPLSYYNTEYMRHHNGATPAPNEMNDKQSLNYKSPQRKYLRRMGIK